MSGTEFFDLAIVIAFSLTIIAFFLTLIRLVLGPTLPDRVLSLDMLVTLAIGFIATFTILTGYYGFLDMAIALGLVGFLATIAFARFVLHQGAAHDSESDERDSSAKGFGEAN